MKSMDNISIENIEAGKKMVEAAQRPPRGGVYGDDTFYKAYIALVKDLGELIPKDSSHGAMGLHGVAPIARARCKAIVQKARTMSEIMNAITKGR